MIGAPDSRDLAHVVKWRSRTAWAKAHERTAQVARPQKCAFAHPAGSALLRRDALDCSPFLEQRLPPTRIALVGEFQCGDAIGAEMAIVTTQFAPRRDDADAIEKPQRKRPHRAPRLRAVLVDIGDAQLAFGSNGLADRCELRVAGCDRIARPDQEPGGVGAVPQIVVQKPDDPGEA